MAWVSFDEFVALEGTYARPRITPPMGRHPDEPVARETLLYRDWLRSNPVERDRYAALKARLVSRSDQHVDDYGEQKKPFISAAIARAEDWAKATGWRP